LVVGADRNVVHKHYGCVIQTHAFPVFAGLVSGAYLYVFKCMNEASYLESHYSTRFMKQNSFFHFWCWIKCKRRHDIINTKHEYDICCNPLERFVNVPCVRFTVS